MEIKINFDVLIQEFITPDDYVFLWGLYSNYDLSEIEIYPNYKQLEEKGLIKVGENYILTEQGRRIFQPKDLEAKFLEFWTTYPFRAENRPLRDKHHDTKQAGICKKKYELILRGNPGLHNIIMKGLHNYIKNTPNKYLAGIEVFLNQHMWNKFPEEIEKREQLGSTGSI